jgi:hypothetical protein
MRSPASVRSVVLVPVATLGLAVLAGCSEDSKVSSPDPLAARSGTRVTLTTGAGTGNGGSGIITSSMGGISCSVAGSSASGTCSKLFKRNAVVTLTAKPSTGSVFNRWEDPAGACTPNPEAPANSCQITMSADRSVKAVFAPATGMLTLSLTVGGEGSGRVTSNPAGLDCSSGAICIASFPSNTTVRLTATATSGSFIASWSGAGCDGNGTGVNTGTGSCPVMMSQAQMVSVAFNTSASVATLGQWNVSYTWPGTALPIHAHLLPNGKVLTFGRAVQGTPKLWSPGGPPVNLAAAPSDEFCSAHVFLPDGRLLVVGGHSGTDNVGIKSTNIYDYASNSWVVGSTMQNARWYPTATTLSTGEVLALSGGDTIKNRNLIPEVWSNGSWRVLSTASKYLEYYPMVFAIPNGRAFVAGPTHATYFLNTTGTGSWSDGPPTIFTGTRSYGAAVMYEPGKILLVGGGDPPTATAETIDLNAGGGWQSTGSMAVARRLLNATILADGTVLVTGGSNAAGFNSKPTTTGANAVLAAELWDPATGQWRRLSRMGHFRLYHSAALLLPDARVLSLGSGQPPSSGLTDDMTSEIFTPPYLYKADGTLASRPTLTNAPASVAYGQAFSVQTGSASSIAKVTWVRLSSVTHSTNMDQRLNRLSFSVSGATSLSVTAPSSADLAPPGYYMLFLINSSGVPSVASIVRIS